jgi:hypothetical protein
MSVTTYDVINGVSAAIYGVYGDEYRIYADTNVEQGLAAPCFFIAVTDVSATSEPHGRQKITTILDVIYFPKGANDYVELTGIGDALFFALNVIDITSAGNPDGGKLRGINRSYRINGGLLHLGVEYGYTLMPENTDEKMETLTQRLF